jgi:hypothetical protein
MILIVTSPADQPANIVEALLRERGADVMRFDLAQFPSAANITVSYREGRSRFVLRTSERTVAAEELTAVWFRKPNPPSAPASIADEEVRRVVEQDCREFLAAVWDSLACRALPGIPDQMIRAQRKASQMGRAQALGFEVPSTAFTNDPQQFLDLYREHSGRLISKIMASLSLRSRFGTHFARLTEVVTTRDVAHAESIALCPIVLQAHVLKRLELRVTVVGQRVFAAAIDSQATHRTRLDWRRYNLSATPHVTYNLPKDIADRCVRLVAEYGLSYGAIDLILTPDGRYVFLELNSAGEYAWIEALTGLPIGTAIAHYLLGECTDEPAAALGTIHRHAQESYHA